MNSPLLKSLLILLLLVGGCQGKPPQGDHGHAHATPTQGHDDHGHGEKGHDDHGHDDHAHGEKGHDDHAQQKSQAEQGDEPIARTGFTERLENFFEYAPLKPGQKSSFLIHLTDLSDGTPVAQARVVLRALDEKGAEAAKVEAKVGKVTGIYVADVTLDKKGAYTIEFQVKNEKLEDTLVMQNFMVGLPSETEEEPAPENLVSFLMEQQWTIRMTLAQAQRSTVSRQVAATGRVVAAPNHRAKIASPQAGVIVSGDLPRVGSQVYQEQPLVRIRQTPSAAERAQIESSLRQLEASVVQTRAQLRFQNHQAQVENARLSAEKAAAKGEVESARLRLREAEREERRAAEVFAVEGISEKEMEEARLRAGTARVAYETAQKRAKALAQAAPVAAVDLDANLARVDSDPMLVVRAPFLATVTRVYKSLGETVGAGEAILELGNFDTVWLEAPVFERDLANLDRGATASFTVPAFPGREFKGRLIDLGAVIDEQTRAATVVFEVPNPDGVLRLGMQAQVRLAAADSTEAVLIPHAAVLENEGKKFVYVLVSGEEFTRRPIVLGDRYGPRVAVLEGLKAGERVVDQGAYQLKLQELSPADPGVHSHEH